MAKIFISYAFEDINIADEIANNLIQSGHEVEFRTDVIRPGTELSSLVLNSLRNSDIFIILVSEHVIQSQNSLLELGVAVAFSESDRSVLLIPVLLDRVELPPPLLKVQYLTAYERNVEKIAQQINHHVAAFLGRRAAEKEQEIVVKQRIEVNAAQYITPIISSLQEREKRDRSSSNRWYLLGYITLFVGVAFAAYGTLQYTSFSSQDWIRFAFLGLKSLIIVGLLIACSKYSFTLGNSYMHEALKSADRIHAISFGQFYLRVSEAKSDWGELKEVFEHWNIDKGSIFEKMDSSQFDPKFVEAIIEIAKVVSSAKK